MGLGLIPLDRSTKEAGLDFVLEAISFANDPDGPADVALTVRRNAMVRSDAPEWNESSSP